VSEAARRTSNRDRVLAMLQAHGSATNDELIHVGGFRYGARVHELKSLGYDIRTERVKGGLFRFTYHGLRAEPRLF